MQIGAHGQVLLGPSDPSTWASCEWAFLRRLDATLGRGGSLREEHVDQLGRAARLGDQHELDDLAILKQTREMVEFDRPSPLDYATCAMDARAALRAGADVLYQPTCLEPPTAERPGFIARNGAGEWEVYDTKLARHAKINALLQLTACAERLRAHGPCDIAPVCRTQRTELEGAIAERIAEHDELRWGDPTRRSGRRSARIIGRRSSGGLTVHPMLLMAPSTRAQIPAPPCWTELLTK